MQKEKSRKAAEARGQNADLMALYLSFLPDGSFQRSLPKYIADLYGNRIRLEGISIG